MLTRYAIFDGKVREGLEIEMQSYVNETLAPLWRKFSCAKEVRVMFGVEQDKDGPNIPLILAISYENHEGMAKALDSPARYTSRDLLPAFYEKYFEKVKLLHYVMDTQRFVD